MAYINGKKVLFYLQGGSYEQGKQDFKAQFARAFTNNGVRTNYAYAFSHGWNTESYQALKNEKITVILGQYLFYGSTITDISGVPLDTSKATALEYAFCGSAIEVIPPIDVRATKDLNGTFGWVNKVKKIEKIIIRNDGTNKFTGTFNDAPSYEAIYFEGVIGQPLDVSTCNKLIHPSLMNIINCLMAYVVAENKELTNTANSTVMSNAKLVEGKVYSMEYKAQEYDQAQTTISTLAEFSQDMTASVINIPNVGERVGVWQQCAHWADPDVNWYKVYIYQDGDDIKELRCIVNKQTGEAHAHVFDGDVLSIKVDQTATHSVTLGTTNLAKLNDSEKAIATEKGWTLA